YAIPPHAKDLEVAEHVGCETRPDAHRRLSRRTLKLRRSAFRLLRHSASGVAPVHAPARGVRAAAPARPDPRVQKIQERTRITRPITRMSQAAERSAAHTPVNPSSASRIRIMPMTSRTSIFPPQA